MGKSQDTGNGLLPKHKKTRGLTDHEQVMYFVLRAVRKLKIQGQSRVTLYGGGYKIKFEKTSKNDS